MPRARSASATSGCSSPGIGASWPGRALTALWVTSRSSVRPASSSSSQGSMSLTTTIGCETRAVLRATYLDLDGTLLGHGGSLFRDADGAFTLLGARALEACARAGVEVVPYSGRRQSTMVHETRMLGVSSYIFEAGCGLVLDGEVEWLTDGLEPRDGRTIHDQIEASGAVAMLLSRYAGRLEVYSPWSSAREVSVLFLGE